MTTRKRQFLISGMTGLAVLAAVYASYVRLAIRQMDVDGIVAYVAYPEKLATEELILLPDARGALLSELDRRSSRELMAALKKRSINAYFIISWADLDLDGNYDSDRLATLIDALEILGRKGFDASYLSKDGCTAFHEAAIHRDRVGMRVLREHYSVDVVAGNPESRIDECKQNIRLGEQI